MNILSKNHLIKGLRRCDKGLHLSTYLNLSNSNYSELYAQLSTAISEAQVLLQKELSTKEVAAFLRPLKRLQTERSIFFSKQEGSWAVFRTISCFRFLRLPFAVRPFNVVADSFHIKPLLKWETSSADNYLLFFGFDKVSLYRFQYGELRLVSIIRSSRDTGFEMAGRLRFGNSFRYRLAEVDNWLADSVDRTDIPLILAGSGSDAETFRSLTTYPIVAEGFVAGNFLDHEIGSLKYALKNFLFETEEQVKRKALKQLNKAHADGRTDFSLKSIARWAVCNQIQRLYIAEDAHIWGELDRVSGHITLHENQTNCQDDDILDDVAEVVLKNGGQVVLVTQDELPKDAPMAAILKSSSNFEARANVIRPPRVSA